MALVGSDTGILVVSDHAAKAMIGGVCVNEILREAGWLALREEPRTPTFLEPAHVDWTRTRAWGEGGYYARLFLNLADREPHGIVPAHERDAARRELAALFGWLSLRDGPTIQNEVVWPESAYRRVRGLAPDLIVLLGDLHWRSLGSVGHGRTWQVGNDMGVDEANHAQDGIFIFHAAGVRGRTERASILDITPTALDWLGLPPEEELSGRSLLQSC